MKIGNRSHVVQSPLTSQDRSQFYKSRIVAGIALVASVIFNAFAISLIATSTAPIIGAVLLVPGLAVSYLSYNIGQILKNLYDILNNPEFNDSISLSALGRKVFLCDWMVDWVRDVFKERHLITK